MSVILSARSSRVAAMSVGTRVALSASSRSPSSVTPSPDRIVRISIANCSVFGVCFSARSLSCSSRVSTSRYSPSISRSEASSSASTVS